MQGAENSDHGFDHWKCNHYMLSFHHTSPSSDEHLCAHGTNEVNGGYPLTVMLKFLEKSISTPVHPKWYLNLYIKAL